MRFSILKTAATAFALCGDAVTGALTPSQIVSNINMITQKSQALQAPAQSITIVNGPLIIVGQGPFPQIIAGFTDIVSTATTALAQMEGTAPIARDVSSSETDLVARGPDADAIFDAFRAFVRVHQVLLNILIGKAGLFETVPFIGQPVAAVLRQVENVVDTFAFSLIDLVQSRATDIQNQADSLGMTLTTAINSYSGVNVNNKRSTDSGSFRTFRA